MGIVNVTPDSFSDGGDRAEAARAIAAGIAMRDAGAAIIDVGGESTRPGAAPVSAGEEISRVAPVVRGLAEAGCVVSIDTRNAATMQASLTAGAAIVNDVSAFAHDPRAATVCAKAGCAVILMHMRGTPATMESLAQYEDVAAEVAAELAARVDTALKAGVKREAICLDPGIGFAKTATQNAALLAGLGQVAALGFPLLAGVSRKRVIGHFGATVAPKARFPGSIAAGLFALSRGAGILRVHDVAETVQAVRVWQALAG
jgi:dihydropteroate synthase